MTRPAPTVSSGSARHKTTRRVKGRGAAQGSALPPDRSRIEDYPVGCCVLVDTPHSSVGDSAGEAAWYLVAFRIGSAGRPHLRLLSSDPSGPGWNVGMGDARESRSGVLVLGSRWPHRQGASVVGSEEDPLNAEGDPADGSILMDFMGKTTRSPEDPALEWISDCGVITPVDRDFAGPALSTERKCEYCSKPCVARVCAASSTQSGRPS